MSANNKVNESVLTVEAFLLDMQIEQPDTILYASGEKEILFSEILAKNPGLLQKLLEKRAKVYRQLGWEVPNAKR